VPGMAAHAALDLTVLARRPRTAPQPAAHPTVEIP